MDIRKILADYDSMFGRYSLAEIEEYLKQQLQQAKLLNDNFIQVTLLNELIGLCRDTSQKEKALAYCKEQKQLADSVLDKTSADYATVLLNIANAYGAFGFVNEADDYYRNVLATYDRTPGTSGYLYASLYNNWSHVHQMTGNYLKAKELLEKALYILMSETGNEIQQATTRVNLASALMQLGSEDAYGEAMNHLYAALAIFEKDGGKDFHYSAALVAMGDACAYKNDYKQAQDYYSRGLKEIEKHTGRNANYEKTLAKYNAVLSGLSNMERSRQFYEQYGRAMIHNEFPEYESRIAVGLVGEGSDCFGFDDEISADHDYAPGFCMWLTNEDYEKVGARLQQAYDRLLERVYQYKTVDRFLKDRRGALTIKEFYENMLRVNGEYHDITAFPYWNCSEDKLAAATNGQVFRDDLGIFTGMRNKLREHYPEEVFRRKLAQEMHEFSQYAQSNYPRMMARGDQLTANLCINKAVESAMNMCYLMHREYAPYYKWKRKGLNSLSNNAEFRAYLDEIAVTPCQKEAWTGVTYSPVKINTRDKIIVLFEAVARELVNAMHRRGFIRNTDELFLEALIPEVLNFNQTTTKVTSEGAVNVSSIKEELIRKIMALEWKQFDRVHNEGGRAACQDDYETFKIMRLSQYMTWPVNLLDSFCKDLQNAEDRGWNLITEKYGRMMQSNAPEQYEKIREQLPRRSEERLRLQESIILIQVGWMDNFVKEFPAIAGGSRKIRTSEDTLYDTSYETYIRGEISTYSDETFVLYAGFIADSMKSGRNITREIMENTVILYGYKSLEDAELKQENRR